MNLISDSKSFISTAPGLEASIQFPQRQNILSLGEYGFFLTIFQHYRPVYSTLTFQTVETQIRWLLRPTDP